MNFQHLTVLLPCYSLEELATEQPGDQAEQLLSAWSALWHPALVAAVGKMPHWSAAASPPQEPAGHLCVLPPCCEHLLPADWLAEAQQGGAVIIRHLAQRPQIVLAALELLATAENAPGAAAPGIEPPLAADFLALGFCHFAVELLTRKIRYMSNLDEPSFESQLVDAARAACQGDAEAAGRHLQAAFDLLHSSREYFYPVEPKLLDLTLVASTTLGQSLQKELASGEAVNLLVCGQVIEEMARRQPDSLRALRDALANNRVSIVGGEYTERELPLLPPEAIAFHLRRGLDTYQRHLQMQPAIFGRRRFGLTPVLPQILERFGFIGAVHATLDDGRFPGGNQSRTRWEGLDGTSLEALTRIPDDVGRADAFLGLAPRLGNSLDLDHTTTVVCAHWPAGASPWYQDLRRIAFYTSVLGRFSTITDYFQQTTMTGQQIPFAADEYRSPYLQQAVAAGRRDPLSRWVRYFQRRAVAESAQTLAALAALAGVAGEEQFDLDALWGEIEDAAAGESPPEETLDARLRERLDSALRLFAGAVTGRPQAGPEGILVANPCSFSRRLCLGDTKGSLAGDCPNFPVNENGAVSFTQTMAIDVPPLGFAWFGPGSDLAGPQSQPSKWSLFHKSQPQEKPLVQQRPIEQRGARASGAHDAAGAAALETILRNEFFTIVIDPHSGAIRSISDYHSRDPRLAQQLALRMASATGENAGKATGHAAVEAAYSIMAADEVVVASAGPLLGEVVVRGRLISRGGQRQAGFQQTTRIWRGSRVIELLLELDPVAATGSDPWNSYYAARFAWSDETAKLHRSVNLANVPTELTQLESPHFIDIRTAKTRTTLLVGGLPYHCRVGPRKLDSLLIVPGESCRRFRLGIGIDLPSPLAAAVEFMVPPTMLACSAPRSGNSGWLFHLDVRSVVATHWEPTAGGFRLRLLETDGRHVQLNLRALGPLRSARKLGVGGQSPQDLPLEGDRMTIDLRPYEWAEVEAELGSKAEG